jgi:TetR/AcrR family transcriptional regulator, transcriptional repressor for nem operon
MARPREFDEHQVLEAARDAFWNTGYEGTSIDDLTTATGLGKGSLYAAFGGKRELFERVFSDHCAKAVARTAERLAGPDAGALERLRKYVYRTATNSGPAGDGLGCLIAKTTAEIGNTDPVIGAQTRATYEALAESLIACIAAAQRHGDIAASADPRSLGTLLLAALRGIESLGKGGVPAAMLRRAAEAALEALPRV